MDVHTIILFVVGTLEFFLFLFFLKTNSGDRLRRYYALFVLSIALWVLFVAFFELAGDRHFSATASHIIDRLVFFPAILISSFFLLISWLFPFPSLIVSRKHTLTIWIPIIFWGVIILFTGLVVRGEFIHKDRLDTTYGILFPFFGLTFLTYWIWGVINLFSKYKSTTGVHRWLINRFLVGIIGSSVIGVFSNLLIPLLYGYQGLWWLGPEASVIWLGITSYIVFRGPQ